MEQQRVSAAWRKRDADRETQALPTEVRNATLFWSYTLSFIFETTQNKNNRTSFSILLVKDGVIYDSC